MNITFACTDCDQASRVPLETSTTEVVCDHCGKQIGIRPDAMDDEKIHRCLICPSTEMYVRKDFSQRLGVTIIGIGLAASCIPWYFQMWYATYGILFGTALLDALLYRMTGNLLQCYRCHSEYRGVPGLEKHSGFNLEIHERHRQEVARLEQNQTSPPVS